MADDTSTPRRFDLKQMGLGAGAGAFLLWLSGYIGDKQRPLEIKIDTIKESVARIETDNKENKKEILKAFTDADTRNAEVHRGHENRLGNLEFVVLTTKKGK